MQKIAVTFLIFIILLAQACNTKEETPEVPSKVGSLSIKIEHVFDNEPIVLNSQTYRNANGDEFVIQKFKYYLSNWKLLRSDDGEYLIPDSYKLVEVTRGAHLFEMIFEGIPEGEYEAVSFAIGIDPERNLSTDQIGDLDPNNEMAWDWNTGYKFLLFEGRTTAERPQGIVFHIGEDENYVPQYFEFDSKLQIETGKQAKMQIICEAAELFRGTTLVDFAVLNDAMFGRPAAQIRENYQDDMLRLKSAQ
ncbi:MAG: hypothetical protein JJT94_05360 [Bernardetiaceae bacterium]|nr:hypothetical protein [Bernardetiaceae bacterium]